MAKPSAYQRQATGRTARATKQVVVSEGRVRAAARVLADADKAAASVEVVNKTYGTDYPAKSKYVQLLGETGISDAIGKTAEAAPTLELQALVGTFEDSKDGAELPGLAVLGEYVAPVAEKAAKPKKPAAKSLTRPRPLWRKPSHRRLPVVGSKAKSQFPDGELAFLLVLFIEFQIDLP